MVESEGYCVLSFILVKQTVHCSVGKEKVAQAMHYWSCRTVYYRLINSSLFANKSKETKHTIQIAPL